MDRLAARALHSMIDYDALLLVSFGGPEGPDDVMPFLRNVVAGRDVPEERLADVARHYELFGGVSPINDENRALLRGIVEELNLRERPLSVYWANRFWHPLLGDVLQQMADDGVRRALALVTSAYGSPSGCRAYQDDIERARAGVEGDAPTVEKLRHFFNHPGFIEPMVDRAWDAFEELPLERRTAARLVFSAHSIPLKQAAVCPYERQLREACRLVAERLNRPNWELAYQSRSGPPGEAWLTPDLGSVLRRLRKEADEAVVVVPIGFLCDHMEVVYDLDIEAQRLCEEIELEMVRAATIGAHPRFVRMVGELVDERIKPNAPRIALGHEGPFPDACPTACCRELPEPR